ncbi:F-box/WD repeat-containing protein 7-like isoform X2 [Babylonia areolata]|uniref:F-box/WD repeat-containing protein 7-like isoform X2 n=1 Tax=Babylonia areolata TaxID=304850 RepID=UPI003FD32582
MARRQIEVSSSFSALQLERDRISVRKEFIKGKKKVGALNQGAENTNSSCVHSLPTSRKQMDHADKNSVSSRTRAKIRERLQSETGTIRRGRRRGRRRRCNVKQEEKASIDSESSPQNLYPTPSSSAQAVPLTRSSSGRRIRASIGLCQKASAAVSSTSSHSNRNPDGEHVKVNAVNGNGNADSDRADNEEEEETDNCGEDDVRRDRGSGEEGGESDDDEEADVADGVRVESREDWSREGGRGLQEEKCSCLSSWSCGRYLASPRLWPVSSPHTLKTCYKRSSLDIDEEDVSFRKKWRSGATYSKQEIATTSGTDGGASSLSSVNGAAELQDPPRLQQWLDTFKLWSNAEKAMALDDLISHCELPEVRHMRDLLEPHFQRDFISLLPKELAMHVLSFLKPKDLLKAAQTCRYWQVLCEDNLLWREKCMEEGIDYMLVFGSSRGSRRHRHFKDYKGLYLRQSGIESRWRSGKIEPAMIMKSHDDHVITCLEFCGQRIVSGSDDNTLKVWSAVSGKCLRTLTGHTGGVWATQMSGSMVISGSTDRTLRIWNTETGVCKHTLHGHTSTVRCMSLFGKKVVSGSRDATMRMWEVDTGECLHVLQGHVAAVRCVQYDGRVVVSGAYDYTVRVWNPDTETCLHVLQGHTNRVYSLQFDGLHIVSGSLDTSIRVWNVKSGTCLHTLVGHQSLTSGLELKDNYLVSGNADSTVKVWDVTTGQCLQTLQGPNKHQSAVTCLQFNKKFVVTSSDDGTVKIWDFHSGTYIRNLVTLPSRGSGGVVWRVRCSNTKMVCAAGSRNGTEETKLMVLDFDVE